MSSSLWTTGEPSPSRATGTTRSSSCRTSEMRHDGVRDTWAARRSPRPRPGGRARPDVPACAASAGPCRWSFSSRESPSSSSRSCAKPSAAPPPWRTSRSAVSTVTSCAPLRCAPRPAARPGRRGSGYGPRRSSSRPAGARMARRAAEGDRLLPHGGRHVLHPTWRATAREERLTMAEQRRERSVVTVVFCDLVGFTQRGEQRTRRTSRRCSALPRAPSLRARAPRGHCGEVHRGCRDGAVRCARRARGRSRTRRPRLPCDPRLGDRGRAGADRRYDRRSAHPPRRAPPRQARAWPLATSSIPPRACRVPLPSNGVLTDPQPHTAPPAKPSTIARRPLSKPREKPSRSPSGSGRGSLPLRRRRRTRGAHGARRTRA